MISFPLLPGDIVSYDEEFSAEGDGPFRGVAVRPSETHPAEWHIDFSAIGFNPAAQIPLEHLTLIYAVGSNPFDLDDIS